jgi:hypothetical protein
VGRQRATHEAPGRVSLASPQVACSPSLALGNQPRMEPFLSVGNQSPWSYSRKKLVGTLRLGEDLMARSRRRFDCIFLFHVASYDGFSVDVTAYLGKPGVHELIVWVYDPSDEGPQVRPRLLVLRTPLIAELL